ncbi:glycoside hydrolase family 75 protein [Streptomyces sp. NPDC003023]|uniref:glycoside hydrolase family 75 protein n=1 Tax=Streptomyces sp. NPDC003023 TaxID=3364675 RepID=UPI003691B1E7
MRFRNTALALAVGSAVLGTATLPAAAQPGMPPPPAPGRHRAAPQTPVAAAALLARVEHCAQISRGRYATDRGRPANIPVCEHDGAVFWQADMDIDCDGRRTARCNRATDPSYQGTTAFAQSDGQYLDAEKLPFVVVPAPSRTWDYRSSGVRGGSAAAMIHDGKVVYGVVGDTGPSGIIGEASYAAAEALGIDPDPARGGVSSGVTYILFKDSKVTPIESHAAAVERGEELARRFVAAGAGRAGAADRAEAPAGTGGATAAGGLIGASGGGEAEGAVPALPADRADGAGR